MKKLAVLLVVAAIGFGVWHQFLRPQKRACNKVASLCGADFKEERCEQTLKDLQDKVGVEAVDKFSTCALQASSCANVMGCATGAAVDSLGKAAGDFMKGVGDALKN